MIPRLEELSVGTRVAIGVAIVLLVLLVLVMLGYFGSEEAQGEPLDYGAASRFETRLIELDRLAIDEAYRNQIMHLFEVWMRDAKGQPERAVTGARQARRAYIGAMTEIEKREQLKR